MADETPPKAPPDDAPPLDDGGGNDGPRERSDRGISDFVRRAVAAGFEAASRSKDDVVRVATTEIRGWLDRLELDTEIRKALAHMVLEVKAEIRFRPADETGEDAGKEGNKDSNRAGKLVAETKTELSMKPSGKG